MPRKWNQPPLQLLEDKYKAGRYKKDEAPIDKDCGCMVCQNYSRAYLNHLIRAKEITYFRLATIHNLYYYLNLMRQIERGNF